MIDQRNTAIITYMDSYFVENLEYDFLTSLVDKIHYQGKIVVLDYGIDEADVERLKEKFKIEVHKCNKIVPVFSNRYIDMSEVIDGFEENITHIMTVDGADVWFQDQLDGLFESTSNGVGCVEEKRIFGEDSFSNYCLNKIIKDERNKVKEALSGKKVRNSGVICGPRSLMREVISNVADEIQNNAKEFFGVDQIYFNYEWYALNEENRVPLDEIYNFVMVSNADRYVEKDGCIFTDKGQLVTVVHNAGANWRVLKRPFVNKKKNQEQYMQTRNIKLEN